MARISFGFIIIVVVVDVIVASVVSTIVVAAGSNILAEFRIFVVIILDIAVVVR